jgi:hypothetical protein
VVSRWRWLLVGAIGVLGGAVIAVLGFTVLPRAATVVLLGLAGAGFLAFEAATRTAGRGRERVEVPRNLVMADNDRLPLVRELNDPLVLGVHPAPAPDGERARGGAANAMPPFVDRNVAAELNEALRNDSFVLLVGESVSGKSRLAYEAMRSQLPNHVFVMAGSRAGLETVEQALEANEHCVVWLNDLDRFLGPYGLTPGQVARWRSRGERSVVLLATMQSRQYEEYLARASQAGEPGQAGHGLQLDGLAVLEMARVIPVARDWTDEERSKARQIDDPRIARALQHADKFGLAEHMVAAPQLYEDWKAAWAPGVHPRGAALVAAAIDARRCGWLRPVPRTLLERLHEGYLQRRGGNALRPETIEAALEWAVRSHRGTDSLLIPVGDGRVPEGEYLVFDYLPERLEAERVEIPAQLWRELIQAAEPAEAWDIGQAAYRRREYGWAQQAFAKAGRDGDHTALLAQARAIGRSGRMKEAVELLRGNLSRSGLRLGENHPDAPRTRYELLLWQTKEFELASGPDDPYTLASRHELAVCAAQAGLGGTPPDPGARRPAPGHARQPARVRRADRIRRGRRAGRGPVRRRHRRPGAHARHRRARHAAQPGQAGVVDRPRRTPGRGGRSALPGARRPERAVRQGRADDHGHSARAGLLDRARGRPEAGRADLRRGGQGPYQGAGTGRPGHPGQPQQPRALGRRGGPAGPRGGAVRPGDRGPGAGAGT